MKHNTTNNSLNNNKNNISYQLQLMDLPNELLEVIVMYCDGNLSKFVMHFVCKYFWKMTQDNEQNRKFGLSYYWYFTKNAPIGYKERNSKKLSKPIKQKLICGTITCYGSLSMLKWARDLDYYWDNKICFYAAQNGYLEILKYAIENDCPWNKDDCIELAKKNNHVKIVEWIENNT